MQDERKKVLEDLYNDKLELKTELPEKVEDDSIAKA
jgi:hypothetical protein